MSFSSAPGRAARPSHEAPRPVPLPPVASPCISVCRLEPTTGWCEGCGRTGTEIAEWRGATDRERAAVQAEIPARLDALQTTPAPLGLRGAALADHLEATLRSGEGAFVLGCHGAVAEFMALPDEAPRVVRTADTIVAKAGHGRLRLDLSGGIETFCTQGADGRPQGPMLFAVPDGDPALPGAFGLRRIGTDLAPITVGEDAAPGARAILFDLGLGHADMRFMIRTAAAELIARLDALEGAPLGVLLQEAGAALLAESPTRIVETRRARCEIDGPIPAPGGRSPPGPHTHLLPGPVALGRLMPPGIARPRGFAPVALHYPVAP